MLQRLQLSEDQVHEREVLEEMIRTEGWQVFERRVMAEWKGDGYFARMAKALTSNDAIMPKVIHQTAIEVEGMLRWPKSRIQVLGGGE